MTETRFVASLPTEVADEAIRDDLAAVLPHSRALGDIAGLAVGGLGVAASMVTLAQTPATISYLSQRLHRWSRARRSGEPAVLSVEAQGPGGRLTLELNSATSADEIARILERISALPEP